MKSFLFLLVITGGLMFGCDGERHTTINQSAVVDTVHVCPPDSLKPFDDCDKIVHKLKMEIKKLQKQLEDCDDDDDYSVINPVVTPDADYQWQLRQDKMYRGFIEDSIRNANAVLPYGRVVDDD